MLNRLLCAIALLSLASPAFAAKVTLKNDKVKSDGTVAFQGGFAANEEGGATLGPLTDPCLIQTVQFLFGDSGSKKVTVKIYEESGKPEPGKLLASFPDMVVTGTKKAMNEVDVTVKQIRIPAGKKFRVSILDQDGGQVIPGIAHDASNAPLVDRNWIKAIPGGWIAAPILGIRGNWVIRAVVDTIPGPKDGGAGDAPSGDAGKADAGAGDASSGDLTFPANDAMVRGCQKDGDCAGSMVCKANACVAPVDDGGCRTTAPGGSLLLWGLLLVGIIVARRRRSKG